MNYLTNLTKTGIYLPIFKDDEFVHAIDFVLIWHWKVLCWLLLPLVLKFLYLHYFMNCLTNLTKTDIYPPIFMDDEFVHAIDFVLIWHWKVACT